MLIHVSELLLILLPFSGKSFPLQVAYPSNKPPQIPTLLGPYGTLGVSLFYHLQPPLYIEIKYLLPVSHT